jgi:hypothetical protein
VQSDSATTKHKAVNREGRNIIFSKCNFFKNLVSDEEHVKADFFKSRYLTSQAHRVHNMSFSGDECPIFHLDETWVNQYHSRKNTWKDMSVIEASKFHHGRVAELQCVTLDMQKLASFQRVDGYFVHAHGHVVPITIHKRTSII